MKKHTIMLTYDRVQPVEIDLGLDNLRQLYGSGCQNEQFVSWVPERFAMQVSFRADNQNARALAIKTAIKGLYKFVPPKSVANLQIWLDGEQEPQSDQPGESVRLH